MLICAGICAGGASGALAAKPWFRLTSRTIPTHIAPGGEGTIIVQAINLGNGATLPGETPGGSPYAFSDHLPAGLKLEKVEFFADRAQPEFIEQENVDLGPSGQFEAEDHWRLCNATASSVTCGSEASIEVGPGEFIHFEGMRPILSYDFLEMRLKVKDEGTTSGAINETGFSGGGAASRSLQRPAPISSSPAGFGVGEFLLQPEEEGGQVDTSAGTHPYQLTNVLSFNRDSTQLLKPPAIPRDLEFKLPPGQVGNATAVPQCDDQDFAHIVNGGASNACPVDTAIGVVIVTIAIDEAHESAITVPLFNLTPTAGEPARFGFEALKSPVILDTSVRSGAGEDYGVTVSVRNITQVINFVSATTVFWGAPTDPSHNAARGWGCLLGGFYQKISGQECELSNDAQPPAFLTLPTNCEEPFAPSVTGSSWPTKAAPEGLSFGPLTYNLADDLGNPLSLDACNQLAFSPTIEAESTADSASSPSGLKFNLNFDDEGLTNATGAAQSQLKDTSVVLPEGLTINPSAGVGLGGCSPAQYASESIESLPGAGCPNDSKLGTVEIETPLLTQKIEGSIFIAQPFENPFGSLVALYIVAKNPETGILVKLAGRVEAGGQTGVVGLAPGQLRTTFENNPQLPFDHFKFKFREGQQAPLISPPTCGAFTTLANLTPWSNPLATLTDSSSFTITKGAEGGACPTGGAPPFSPKIEAGTQNNNAGTFSPFYLHLTRTDAEQEISRFSTNLPPGLTGDLSGIPFCSDASIALARTKTGAQEEASPSCPVASQIGHTLVGTGVGAVLAYVPGKIYLAGAYGGDPFSIVSVTSAVVGPFDLGTVVIRFGLKIDPYTAQVSVDPSSSEPIPTILDGIVTHVRDIRVYIERPGNAPFTLNPTSCTPTSIGSTLTSSLGASSTIASPFQTASCANLKFAPKFAVSTSGKTSKAKGASLHVKLTYPNAPQGTYANITRVKVDLPKQLPSQLKTLQKACTAKQFELNPANCPKESMVGKAKAVTPLIPVPLEGPAIFVSHGNEAFPSLIMVLKGAPPYNITINLVGSTFISKSGITSSTFKTVPDQPIGSFELTLPQGKYSALAANGNLCKSKLAMPTEFLAQNGAKINQSTKISVTGCAKAKKAVKKKNKKNKKQTKSHKGGK